MTKNIKSYRLKKKKTNCKLNFIKSNRYYPYFFKKNDGYLKLKYNSQFDITLVFSDKEYVENH